MADATVKFEAGEVVTLKSGGPRMTVVSMTNNAVGVTFFTQGTDGVWHGPVTASVQAVSLQRV